MFLHTYLIVEMSPIIWHIVLVFIPKALVVEILLYVFLHTHFNVKILHITWHMVVASIRKALKGFLDILISAILTTIKVNQAVSITKDFMIICVCFLC